LSLIGTAAVAWAGTVLALDDGLKLDLSPDDTVIPGRVIAPDARWTPLDEHAIRTLGEELISVRPLMHKFDGELEIMSRLETATSTVQIIRDADERHLLYVALAFEGFAVQRYFQAELGTDPAAEPYRVVVGDRVEVKAWVDAIALDPFHDPVRQDISEEPELAAFKETRDRLLYASRSRLIVDDVPPGATVVLDGDLTHGVDWAAGTPVPPGRHMLAVMTDGRIVAREVLRVGSGDTWRTHVPPPPAALDELHARLLAAGEHAEIPEAMAIALRRLPPPVTLAIQRDDGPVMYRVDGSSARRVDAVPTDADDARRVKLHADLRTWIGAAWVHDDDYYLLNQADGAPSTFPTSNGAAPILGASMMWPTPVDGLQAGAGCDVVVPTGRWQYLPVGDRQSMVRLRAHPYAALGTSWAQGTVGIFTPWHIAVGGRLTLPLLGNTDVVAGGAAGVGRLQAKGGGTSEDPGTPYTLFVGIATRFGR
jgi:hypothetical protein